MRTSSQTGNNGSAFAGLSANTVFYNLTGAVAMFVGRFWMIIPTMAIAGSLAAKKSIPASAGTFPTTGGLFVGLVVGVIIIIGGLTFFPALALGPVGRTAFDQCRHPLFSELDFGTIAMESVDIFATAGPYRHSSIQRSSCPRSAPPSSSSIRER